MKYILFAGRKQVGKSTSAEICENILINYFAKLAGGHQIVPRNKVMIVSFAEALKKSVSKIFNIPLNILNGSNKEKDKHSHIVWKDFNWALKKKFAYNIIDDHQTFNVAEQAMTYRELMQYFGEMMRDQVNPLIWVDSVFYDPEKDQKKELIKIIQDLRYLNELETGIKYGGLPILIKRNTGFSDFHASEQIEQHQHLFKYIIDNNGSKDDLAKQIAKVLKTEGII